MRNFNIQNLVRFEPEKTAKQKRPQKQEENRVLRRKEKSVFHQGGDGEQCQMLVSSEGRQEKRNM